MEYVGTLAGVRRPNADILIEIDRTTTSIFEQGDKTAMLKDDELTPIQDSFKTDDWSITAGINTHSSEPLPEGVLARTDWVEASVTGTINRNKRLYERKLWENVLNEERVKAKIEDANGLLGELDHPDYFEEKAKKAGVRTIGMRLNEDDNMEIRFDILDTPAPGTGRVAYALVQAGINLGVSSRGRGKLEKQEQDGEVFERVNPEKYQFATWDAVSGPGFATARINQDAMTVQEAVQCLGEGCDRETVETARKIYEDVTDGLHKPGDCQIQGTDLNEQTETSQTNSQEDSVMGADTEINEQEFQKLQTTVDELSDSLNEKDQRIQELEQTLESKDDKIARLQGEEAQERVDELEQQVEELQEKLAIATETLDDYQDKSDTIKELKEANLTKEEKLDLAYETIEQQDEALDLASETIQEFKEHYLTACDVIEQWQYEDEEADLREHMEKRCKEVGVHPSKIQSIVESAENKQHFDRMLQDVLEARGERHPELEDIDESRDQGRQEPSGSPDVTQNGQRYQNGPNGRTPSIEVVDEQVEEEDLEEPAPVNENEQGPDKKRMGRLISNVGKGK